MNSPSSASRAAELAAEEAKFQAEREEEERKIREQFEEEERKIAEMERANAEAAARAAEEIRRREREKQAEVEKLRAELQRKREAMAVVDFDSAQYVGEPPSGMFTAFCGRHEMLLTCPADHLFLQQSDQFGRSGVGSPRFWNADLTRERKRAAPHAIGVTHHAVPIHLREGRVDQPEGV